jgi:hypothetical protein
MRPGADHDNSALNLRQCDDGFVNGGEEDDSKPCVRREPIRRSTLAILASIEAARTRAIPASFRGHRFALEGLPVHTREGPAHRLDSAEFNSAWHSVSILSHTPEQGRRPC